MTAKQIKNDIKTNPTYSYWVKEQIEVLDQRDILDALRDLSKLSQYLRTKFNEELSKI